MSIEVDKLLKAEMVQEMCIDAVFDDDALVEHMLEQEAAKEANSATTSLFNEPL